MRSCPGPSAALPVKHTGVVNPVGFCLTEERFSETPPESDSALTLTDSWSIVCLLRPSSTVIG